MGWLVVAAFCEKKEAVTEGLNYFAAPNGMTETFRNRAEAGLSLLCYQVEKPKV